MERTTSREGVETRCHPPLQRAMLLKSRSVKCLLSVTEFSCTFVTYLQQLDDSLSRTAVSLSPANAVFLELHCVALGLGQQQREQDRAAFAIDRPVDQLGAEAALERHRRREAIGHVVAETLERKQEAGIGP